MLAIWDVGVYTGDVIVSGIAGLRVSEGNSAAASYMSEP